MSKLAVPPTLKSRSPPLPLSYFLAPIHWDLTRSSNSNIISSGGRLRCTNIELATNESDSLVVILDIQINDLQINSMMILIGEHNVRAMTQDSNIQPGTLYLWGILPKGSIPDEARITLQALSGDSKCEFLDIGTFSVDGLFEETYGDLIPNEEVKIEQKVPFALSCQLPDQELLVEEDQGVPETLPSEYKKMKLNVFGDLNSMTKDWTRAEQRAGRRLVRFRRTRIGPVVDLSFGVQQPGDSYEDDLDGFISCIEWPHGRPGHFVTSYDVLKLTEFILSLSMNTEVKNRARRNMASVSSQTLAKGEMDSDSADESEDDAFMKVMGFEDPKPRSIEKSIKVYDWSNLTDCLSKILSRFVTSHLEDSKEVGPFEHQLDAIKNWKRLTRASKRKSHKQSNPRQRDTKSRVARVSAERPQRPRIAVPSPSFESVVVNSPSAASEAASYFGSLETNSQRDLSTSPISRQPSSCSLYSLQDGRCHGTMQVPVSLVASNNVQQPEQATGPLLVKTETPPYSVYHSALSAVIFGDAFEGTPLRPLSASSMVVQPSSSEVSSPLDGNWQQNSFTCENNRPPIRVGHVYDVSTIGPLTFPQPHITSDGYLHGSLAQIWTSPLHLQQPSMDLDSPIDQESLISPFDAGSDGFATQDFMEDDFDEVDQWLDTDYIMAQQRIDANEAE